MAARFRQKSLLRRSDDGSAEKRCAMSERRPRFLTGAASRQVQCISRG